MEVVLAIISGAILIGGEIRELSDATLVSQGKQLNPKQSNVVPGMRMVAMVVAIMAIIVALF